MFALNDRVEAFCEQYTREVDEGGSPDIADLVTAILQDAAVLMVGGAVGYLRYVADRAAAAAATVTVLRPRGASG